MKKAMLIINPTSGGEKALDYKEILENKAKKYFDDIETIITQKAEDATHFSEKASKEHYDTVIVREVSGKRLFFRNISFYTL